MSAVYKECMDWGPVGLTSWQSSRELTSWAFWQERMEPARLSITHTADSSMKNVICDQGGERGQHEKQQFSLNIFHIVFESSCSTRGTVYIANEPSLKRDLSSSPNRKSTRMSEGINNPFFLRVAESECERYNYRKPFHPMTQDALYRWRDISYHLNSRERVLVGIKTHMQKHSHQHQQQRQYCSAPKDVVACSLLLMYFSAKCLLWPLFVSVKASLYFLADSQVGISPFREYTATISGTVIHRWSHKKRALKEY